MSEEESRRTFLRGTLATAVVVAGFDTGLRSWVSAAELEHHAGALAEEEGERIVADNYMLDGKEMDFTPQTPNGPAGKGKRTAT